MHTVRQYSHVTNSNPTVFNRACCLLNTMSLISNGLYKILNVQYPTLDADLLFGQPNATIVGYTINSNSSAFVVRLCAVIFLSPTLTQQLVELDKCWQPIQERVHTH